MIAVDANILVYAYRTDSLHHQRAFSAFNAVVNGSAPWAIPWHCVHEFISIATHPGIYKPASPLVGVMDFLQSLFAAPNLQILAESPGYFETLRELAQAADIKGPRIYDARIAALCLHHGVTELWSADRDFSAFPKLRVRNPLQ